MHLHFLGTRSLGLGLSMELTVVVLGHILNFLPLDLKDSIGWRNVVKNGPGVDL